LSWRRTSRPVHREKYADGALRLLDAGQWAQALVEFKLAYEAAPRDEYLFNMAKLRVPARQLKDALEHYEAYLRAATRGTAGKGTAPATKLSTPPACASEPSIGARAC